MRTESVFDRSDTVIHHSDRDSQQFSFRYRERLADAGIESVCGQQD